ncbi:hypothetical protein DB346_03230 [Verrucomicrobia bacterium LW23]|nr:hypothetical protein DB346_03230 [Verrucomicrobia bacterium LW23]
MANKSCILVLLLTLGICAASAVPPEMREKDVFYFADNLAEPIRVELTKPVDIFGGRDLTTRLGTAPVGAIVEIAGVTRGLYLITVRTPSRKIEGWVAETTLPPIPREVMDEARAKQDKRDAIAKAIKDRKVILGMAFEDVRKALGRPEKTSFQENTNGRTDTWRYIAYDSVPETRYVRGPYGNVIAQTYYVKVPIGELIIDFSNGAVISVAENRDSASAPSRGAGVPN